MLGFGYMEILLCRFPREQRVWIRKDAKRKRISEAEVVREAVSLLMRYENHIKAQVR
jgi:hypothetical protein